MHRHGVQHGGPYRGARVERGEQEGLELRPRPGLVLQDQPREPVWHIDEVLGAGQAGGSVVYRWHAGKARLRLEAGRLLLEQHGGAYAIRRGADDPADEAPPASTRGELRAGRRAHSWHAGQTDIARELGAPSWG